MCCQTYQYPITVGAMSGLHARLADFVWWCVALDAGVAHLAPLVRVQGETECFNKKSAIERSVQVDGVVCLCDEGVVIGCTLRNLVEDDDRVGDWSHVEQTVDGG